MLFLKIRLIYLQRKQKVNIDYLISENKMLNIFGINKIKK